MQTKSDLRWKKVVARDAGSDGRFLTGVLTTGIYCLPSCPARKPKRENVRFFDTPAAAEEAGLRPCLRCRPEEFYAGRHHDRENLVDLVHAVRRDPAGFRDVGAAATASGVGRTKLSQLFRRHLHTSPASFLLGARLEEAQRLLLGTRRRVLDVAYDCGFESPSTFHENFVRRTALSPTGYRRLGQGRFELRLPEGFRLAWTLSYLGRDPRSPTERIQGNNAVRMLTVRGRPVRVEMAFRGGRVACEAKVRRALSREDMAEVHRQLIRWLGLVVDPAAFESRMRCSALGRRLVRGRRGLRIPQTPTVFEGIVWAIVGQQVNLAFAYRLRRALIECAGRQQGPWLAVHPTPEQIAQLDVEDLTARQFSARKAEYLIDAARRFTEDQWPLEGFPQELATRVEERLLAIRGIGPWSARYVMMRACCFEDCVPVGDAGLTRALGEFLGWEERPDAEKTEEGMASFAPHRSLATMHLWASLDESRSAKGGTAKGAVNKRGGTA